jgi:hypothetical protein
VVRLKATATATRNCVEGGNYEPSKFKHTLDFPLPPCDVRECAQYENDPKFQMVNHATARFSTAIQQSLYNQLNDK